MLSLLLPLYVLLGKGLLQRQKLHRRPCALVEVKDFLGSYKDSILDVVFKTVWASFMPCFLTNYTRTAAIWYVTISVLLSHDYDLLTTRTTEVMTDDSKDNMVKVLWHADHWWRSCDDPIDDLKTTLMTWKMTGNYLVTILLMSWRRPLKI